MAGTAAAEHGYCLHCGTMHNAVCSRISVIEYHENGTIKRVEYHSPQRADIQTKLTFAVADQGGDWLPTIGTPLIISEASHG